MCDELCFVIRVLLFVAYIGLLVTLVKEVVKRQQLIGYWKIYRISNLNIVRTLLLISSPIPASSTHEIADKTNIWKKYI